MKTSLRTLFPSIRPVLMSFHADQILAETAFCSSGQFSLRGPDKSRHCTITSHKSVCSPLRWMDALLNRSWRERSTYIHTNTSAGTFTHRIHTILLLGLIIRWAWGWCLVLMWTGDTVWYRLLYQALNYDIRLPEECKQCLSQGVRVWLFMGLWTVGPVGRRCNCITWSQKTAVLYWFFIHKIAIKFLNLNWGTGCR